MEKMLIRTRQNVRKTSVATKVRVILFFGIPTLYFVYLLTISKLKFFEEILQSGSETGQGFVLRKLLGILENGRNCTPAAILEFPPDGLSRMQRQQGFILVHCVLAVYCFLLLGTVCEQYFVPAIDMICDRLTMEPDIAGATFMAAASSSPELFINCVGTFVTKGDLGVGAVVGSAVFNVLAVPACCAFFAGRVINLDWWSISRDCLMYAVAVVTLILTLLDDRVYWHEALLLVLMYTLYILTMVFNGRLGSFVRGGCCIFKKPKIYTEITPLLIKEKQNGLDALRHLSEKQNVDAAQRMSRVNHNQNDLEIGMEMTRRHDSTGSDASSESSVWSWPDEKTSIAKKFLWLLTWPISLLLWVTIPDCRRHPSLYPLTFIMCITWIGGDTLNLPDSITGLTILAAGTSLPEAVSSVLVTKHGNGTMGISNSIGSNTFDILLCLGLPWLVKALFYPGTPGNHYVAMNSSGISYSAISLLSTLFALYGTLALNKFQLDWRVGVTCSVVYVGFVIFATLLEMNVFFVVNLPTCFH
ncbi:probable sodium/potassium/calcium exchanger CG1090 isoform X2 [Plodia interpunctella]|uniref:probable sodium/potassium/calcium exchanger CG1090 isoform X2 n=1 Tax=Plodia interpunctella TaxID=58824 RepID=UPI00236798FF|nr:probable sodium/potassium/calcium exchanger CG1090 isoform X2 [Plodia interpunctella]